MLGEEALKKLKILVIDQDPSYKTLYKKALEQSNALTICQSKAKLGDLMHEHAQYDLILIDPVIDSIGIKLLEKLKPLFKETTRVIFCSSDSSDLEVRIAFQHEAVDDFICKPFSEEKIKKTVQVSLNQAHQPSRIKNQRKNPLSILIVDDSSSIRDSLERLLKTTYQLELTSNGKEAIEMIDSGYRPDLIILDIMMNNMNGFEVLRTLRARSYLNNTHIVCISLKDISKYKRLATELGATEYFTKPFNDEYLLNRINKLLCQ